MTLPQTTPAPDAGSASPPAVAQKRDLEPAAGVNGRRSEPAQQGPRDEVAAIDKVDKATIVLVALGPEAAAGLLADAGEERITRFARSVAKMGETPPHVVDQVLAEFINRIRDESAVEGGRAEARRFLDQVLSGPDAERVMGELEIKRTSVWAEIAEIDDMRVAEWLKTEHSHVAAVALARLSSPKAARILELLPPDAARAIVLRMGAAASADPAAAERIGEAIRRDILPAVHAGRSRLSPADLIGAVMNHVSPSVRDKLLGAMSTSAPALSDAVRRIMFTFEHIPERVEPRDVIAVSKAIDEPTLLAALKADAARGPEVADFIFDNISKRLADRLREDLAALPQPSRKDGEAAQSAVVAAIVEMRDSGALTFRVEDPEAE